MSYSGSILIVIPSIELYCELGITLEKNKNAEIVIEKQKAER